MDTEIAGALMWLGMFSLAWWNKRRHNRKVSRNTGPSKTGHKWEQIAPMDECFDDLDGEIT